MMRTGRPKSDNPKNIMIRVRIDEQENQVLNEYCEREGIPRTEAIRRGIKKLSEDLGIK